MKSLPDEAIETFLACLPEADRAALTDRLGRAVLAASRGAACLARTGRYRDATVFQLLAFVASAQGELHAVEQLVRERLRATDQPGEPDPPTG